MYTRSEDEGVIIAQPGTLLTEPALPGDRLTRWSPSEGVQYSGIIVSDEPESAESLIARGIPVESAGDGTYVEILEIAPGTIHTRTIGRRLADPSGRVPRGQSVSRPSWNQPAAPAAGTAPTADPYGYMPAPGAYGAAPPAGPYGQTPPPYPYGAPPPMGPYGPVPPPQPYGAPPAMGPYGAVPPADPYGGGTPPMDPHANIPGYDYGYLPPASPPGSMPPPPPAAAPYGNVAGYEYGYLPPTPPPQPGGTSESIDFSLESEPEYAEQIDIDDVAVEMNGLRCEFLEAVTVGRPQGLSRSFRAGEIATITNWNGTSPAAEVESFSVSKLAIAPKYDRVSGIREYVLPLAAQRRAVRENMRELAEWVSRESSYVRNRGLWEREKTRLEDLRQRRQQIYSRMWVRQMMYNRFDPIIARWTEHYNRMLRPRPDLDPNIVKSMLYQETRFGTSGTHLMPPPSDWSLASHHPIRSRFNIGQAIDSFGPQQWLMMREMAPSITAQHGLDALAARDRWIGMSNADYQAHMTFMTALKEFFEHRDGAGRNLMGTPGRDLHEDYAFWIRTAIRWLFDKFKRLSTPTWAEAVRAYNGSGERARRYRDSVMARVGSTDPFTTEETDMGIRYAAATDRNGKCSLCGHDTTSEDVGLIESGPSRDTSARLEWENLTRVPDSKGSPQVFYVVTGAPRGTAAAGHEGKAVLPLRVYNNNSKYNHKFVQTRWRLLKPKQGYREIRAWSAPHPGPRLEDESSRPITFTLEPGTLADAYDSDDPLTRFEMEYHWHERFFSKTGDYYYNSTGFEFALVAPVEFLLSRKTRLAPPEIELKDPQYRPDYWIPIGAGVQFTQHLRTPVTIQVEVSYSLADEFRVDRSATATRSRTKNTTQTTSNTFTAELSGSMSQGAKAGAEVKGLQLGLERMFQLGAKLGYSKSRTDTTSDTVAREFSQSLGISRGYTASQSFKLSQSLTISPVPPAPTGTGTGSTSAPATQSVQVFVYPVVSFFEVPFVKFQDVNKYGQATRRTTGKVAVPFITRWVLTTA